MKRTFALILSILMLFCVSCSEKTPDRLAEGSVRFSSDNLPKLCVTSHSEQLGLNLVTVVLGVTSDEAKNVITVCESPDECYLRLIKGECDIVIAHGYGKAVVTELGKTALQLTSTELSQDALVFIANGLGDKGLTVEEIALVYKKEATNWSAFGGSDTEITLFGAKSGTAVQNAFEKYVAEDITVEPVYKTITTAEGKFTAAIGYDNRPGAIGYTLMSLAGNFNNGTVQPVKINGVTPSEGTVTDKSYPLAFPISVTIRSSEASGNNTRVLHDWILSEQGKAALGIAG